MKRLRRSCLATIAVLLFPIAARAQNEPTVPRAAPVTGAPAVPAARFLFDTYIQRVGQGNLELAAQRASVSVTEAQIAVSRVFPDPQITAGLLQYDVSNAGNPTASIVQLLVPLQIAGQRGARIAFAEATLSAAQADLLEVLRVLRATAANDYVDALRARLVRERKQRTLASLRRLVAVNEQRLKSGDIGEVPVLQSRVEANQFQAEVLDAEGQVRIADLALTQLLGSSAATMMGQRLVLDGDLAAAAGKTFDLPSLVREALAQRPDLLAAKRRLEAANRQIALARANRMIDIGVGGSWQHNFAVAGQSPLPPSDFVGATLSVPIPISRIYRGELDVAHATHRQAEAGSQGAAIRVETDVRQAVAKYEAAAARVKLYDSGVLADADQVLEKTLYNYQRGGSTLVEVLVAQRTDNDVHLAYADALADAAHALIAVQQAVGSWDIHF